MIRKFYVYEHWRPDTSECFYVGKGQKNRAGRIGHRNKAHAEVVATLKGAGLRVDVRIVASDLTEPEAHDLERKRIADWRSKGIVLSNRTDGGEGFSGFIRPLGIRLSAETRAKMSEARKGIKFTVEHREKLAARKLGVKRPPFTDETRARMRAAAAAREAAKREKFGSSVTRWSRLKA